MSKNTEKNCTFYDTGYCTLWDKACIKLPCREFLSQADYEEQCIKEDQYEKEWKAEEMKEKRELDRLIMGDYNYCPLCLGTEFTCDDGICTCTECGFKYEDKEMEGEY